MLTAQKASRSAQGAQGKSFKTSKSMATKFEPPTHPAIIITSAFTASHIDKLKKKLEENYIAYGMQTSKKKVNRPPGAPSDKNFIIVDDSQGPQVLEGEFLGLNMCRVDYPKKNNLDDVIQKFQKYIGLGKETVQQHEDYEETAFNNWQEQEQMQKVGKTLNKGKNGKGFAGGFSGQGNFIKDEMKLENIENILEIKQKAEQFRDVFKKKGKSKSRRGSSNDSSNSKGKKSKKKEKNENLQNSKENKGIVLKSVRKFGEVGENVDSDKRALFILKTQKQSMNYRQYVQKFQSVKNKRIMVIRSLQDYYKNCYAQGEGQNCLLLSPNVAFKELHKFRNLKDVYIYGDDPKFCAQLVKGNIKKAAVDSKEMDNILLSQGFNKDELKALIEPMRRVGSKMDLDQSDPKLSKKGKEKYKEKEKEEDKQKKEKEKDKPSLFGRFVDFVKGKSKNKDKQKEKQKQKAKNKQQKNQSSVSRSSSSEIQPSESRQDKNANMKKGNGLNQKNKNVDQIELKGPERLKNNSPSEPQPDYLEIDNEQKKGLISLGQLLDNNNKEGDNEFVKKKQPKITITRIKSNNKISGEGTQKSSKDQNQNANHAVKPIQPLKLSKQQNDKASFQISRPPEKEILVVQPIKPRQNQQEEDAMFQIPQKKQKEEQKGKYKVGGGMKRGSDQYKQLRFNLSKPVQSQKDINNFKVPKLEKGKRRQKQSTSSSSQSDNMIGGGKAPPSKKNKQRKNKRNNEKQNEEDSNVYYQIKPPPSKPEKQRQNKKISHKVQDIGEEREQKQQVSNNMPSYLPSRAQESNGLKLMNNKKVAPAFCEQNSSQGQDAFQFGNNNYNNRKSQRFQNQNKKQSEDNFYYNPSALQKQLSETVPNARGQSLDSQLSMTYPKVGKNNGKSPFQRENTYNCYTPSNPNSNSYSNQQPKPRSQYQNHPNNFNINGGNLQPNLSSQQPLNQPTNRNLYQAPPSGQPFIMQGKQPFSQPLGHLENNTLNQPLAHNPYRLNSTRPVGPSNENLARPLSYSVHNPSTDFNLPFDQTKYDKTIENGVTVYRPKKIPFHLGVMPATVIRQDPAVINPPIIVGKNTPIPPIPTYPISNSYHNPNIILQTRQSPNRPMVYSEQKPQRETASTYYQKIPVQAVSPTPNKKDTFSTYEYFMNNNELPIFSPASPHQQNQNPDRITPCKSVLVCDKLKQFDTSQPVYQCHCKNKNNHKQKKRKASWHQNDQNGKSNRKPRNTQKENEHDCENPTKLKKKMTKTKQAFYDMQSDDSSYHESSNFKTRPRNAKSLSKSAQQPFNSSILDNISSRVQKPDRSNKNFTVLYLVNSNLNPKLMKQLFEISDQSDTIQTFPYSHPDKIVDLAKKGENVFDFVVVHGGSNADKIAFQNVQLGTCKGVYYVIYDSDAIQSSVSERNITLRVLTDLTIILNGMYNNKFIDFDINTSKSHKIGYIYFKDFNFPIRRMAKMLKAQYPNCQVRRYFGLLDLPTKLPNMRNETTIILLDQVSFNQMSSYCSQQEKQNPNILKICIPKSRQAMKLCQKSPASQKIVWLTEEELDNWEFLVKRIQKRIR